MLLRNVVFVTEDGEKYASPFFTSAAVFKSDYDTMEEWIAVLLKYFTEVSSVKTFTQACIAAQNDWNQKKRVPLPVGNKATLSTFVINMHYLLYEDYPAFIKATQKAIPFDDYRKAKIADEILSALWKKAVTDTYVDGQALQSIANVTSMEYLAKTMPDNAKEAVINSVEFVLDCSERVSDFEWTLYQLLTANR